MSSLLVRNLDDTLVQKLKQRAATHARSAEAEHRAILEAALRGTQRRNIASLLASMPNVGVDADFARECNDHDASDVLD